MVVMQEAMLEMFLHGVSVSRIDLDGMHHIPLIDFWKMPEPLERNPWPDRVFFPPEPYDDGGGAALAAYQFGLCSTAPRSR